MARRKRAPQDQPVPDDEGPVVEIPEDEQWRIINQTGILDRVQEADRASRAASHEPITLVDELFNTLLYAIPFSSLLLLMEILIHRQYSREPTLADLRDRMVPGVPLIFIFIFYTLRHKSNRYVQLGLFLLGSFTGARLIWAVNRATWTKNIQQCPPLATSWVYAIVLLDLPQAVLSLAIVGAYTWFSGFSLTP